MMPDRHHQAIHKAYAKRSADDALYDAARAEVRVARDGLVNNLRDLLRASPKTPWIDIGSGAGGFFDLLVRAGLPISQGCAVDLREEAIGDFARSHPQVECHHLDARKLPWKDGHFQLVAQSTMLSSVLDPDVRTQLATEMWRVVAPGGCVVSYDFRWNNPRNPDVRRLTASELQRLFPQGNAISRSLTLAPPISRRVAPISMWVARGLDAVPWLHSHLLVRIDKACS